MLGLNLLDYGALTFFITAWLSYHVAVEFTPARHGGLNVRMNKYRRAWMEQMLARENRMVDANIMGSGDVRVDGQVESVDASIAGSGDVAVASVRSGVSQSVMGSGGVTVAGQRVARRR